MRTRKVYKCWLIFLSVMITTLIYGSGENSQGAIVNASAPAILNCKPDDLNAKYRYTYEFNTSAYIAAKGVGDCNDLTGDVLTMVIFVDDLESKWTEKDIRDVKNNLKNASDKLMKEAQDYGVELNLSFEYASCQINSKLDRENNGQEVSISVLEAANLSPEAVLQGYIKEEYSVKEMPIIFALNKTGRSFANACPDAALEKVVLYRGESAEEEEGTYIHELAHLFGAEDFYYPKEVAEVAQKYLPDSRMMDSVHGSMDTLTAYLIGWTKEPSKEAEEFIRETAEWTEFELAEANLEEQYTGNKTIRWDNREYSGEIVDGLPHGQGKMTWDNGAVYEGEWKHGAMHGQGRMIMNDGTIYEGEWENNEQNGYGAIIWTDGVSYTGYLKDGLPHGQGTLTGPDGSIDEGIWENGVLIS